MSTLISRKSVRPKLAAGAGLVALWSVVLSILEPERCGLDLAVTSVVHDQHTLRRSLGFRDLEGAGKCAAIEQVFTGSSAITIADYANDNIDVLFLGSAEGYFAAYDFAAKFSEWQSPQSPSQQQAVAVKQADMNGDGYADLVGLSSGGYIEIHDVHAHSLLWRSTQLGGGVALALGDLDNDGEQEIIVALTAPSGHGAAQRLAVRGCRR